MILQMFVIWSEDPPSWSWREASSSFLDVTGLQFEKILGNNPGTFRMWKIAKQIFFWVRHFQRRVSALFNATQFLFASPLTLLRNAMGLGPPKNFGEMFGILQLVAIGWKWLRSNQGWDRPTYRLPLPTNDPPDTRKEWWWIGHFQRIILNAQME